MGQVLCESVEDTRHHKTPLNYVVQDTVIFQIIGRVQLLTCLLASVVFSSKGNSFLY